MALQILSCFCMLAEWRKDAGVRSVLDQHRTECRSAEERCFSFMSWKQKSPPACRHVHNAAAVGASILYRKWLLRQRSNGCEALRRCAPPSLSPRAEGRRVPLLLCHGAKRALAAETCLPPTRAPQDSSVTRYAANAASFFDESARMPAQPLLLSVFSETSSSCAPPSPPFFCFS